MSVKPGDKLKVVDAPGMSQTYMKEGSICEYIKTYENYYCVLFEGCEYLMNKNMLVSALEDARKDDEGLDELVFG